MAKRRKRTAKKVFSFIIALILCVVGYFTYKEVTDPVYEVPEGEAQVHFIDVGQGDSILVMTKDGNILIDAGTAASSDDLKSYLNGCGVSSFEYVIFTHPDGDHIGGAKMIVDDFKIENIIMPDRVNNTKTYTNLLSSIEKKDVNVIRAVSGDEYKVGDFNMKILAPNGDGYGDNNNYSVVTLGRYGNVKFMFTGDAEVKSESEILEKYQGVINLKCDVLKVGHHGSDTSTGDAFLAAVSPEIAVISCGEKTQYGHPSDKTLEKLKNSTVYITHELGTVVLVTDGTTVHKK